MRLWPLVCLLPLLLLLGCARQTALRAPKAFIAFKARDRAFRGERPDGWRELSGVGKDGMSAVSLTFFDVRLGITAEKRTPENTAQRLHAAHRGRASEGLLHYQELPAQPQKSELGEGFLSEFTGELRAPMGVNKVHGYRVTVCTKDREISLVARCWDSDWAAISPAFRRVINSLAPG